MSLFDGFSLVEYFGLPMVALGFFFYGIYRAFAWLGSKLDPIFKELSALITDHRRLIKELELHLRKNDELFLRQVELLENEVKSLSHQVSEVSEDLVQVRGFCDDFADVFGYFDNATYE